MQVFCFSSSINGILKLMLRKKFPYLELFWSKCGKIRTRITLNTDTLRSAIYYMVK